MAPVIPDPRKIKSFSSVAAFEKWMKSNHARETEIWLKVHKKDSGLPSVTTAQALDLTLKTLDDLKHGALAPDMLESARAYVLGQYPLQLETAAHWAGTLSDLEFYGLGKEYIEGYGPALAKVDLAETAAVTADACPRPTDLVVVLIGDAAKIREAAQKYGPVTEMKLSDPDFAAPK